MATPAAFSRSATISEVMDTGKFIKAMAMAAFKPNAMEIVVYSTVRSSPAVSISGKACLL